MFMAANGRLHQGPNTARRVFRPRLPRAWGTLGTSPRQAVFMVFPLVPLRIGTGLLYGNVQILPSALMAGVELQRAPETADRFL